MWKARPSALFVTLGRQCQTKARLCLAFPVYTGRSRIRTIKHRASHALLASTKRLRVKHRALCARPAATMSKRALLRLQIVRRATLGPSLLLSAPRPSRPVKVAPRVTMALVRDFQLASFVQWRPMPTAWVTLCAQAVMQGRRMPCKVKQQSVRVLVVCQGPFRPKYLNRPVHSVRSARLKVSPAPLSVTNV